MRTRTWVLGLTTILSGLYAGFCVAYALTVMPGLAETDDETFVVTMRAVNAATPSVPFALIFGGPVVLGVVALVLHRRQRRTAILLAAALACALGTAAVTLLGNVPLNGQLARAGDPAVLRQTFESSWVTFHLLRTVLAIGASGLVAVASAGARERSALALPA
ncbi:DUF1772 domain-containing protein [Hamadaea sp. NPDC050747]|uniref:DUF1772 domain-containing protein n=1 Tax=Hamadaea sp. NPDC050747 TaxID=3155789 RepID=UPI0033C69AD9